MAEKTPWCGCKVAFPVIDPDPIWDHFDGASRGGLPDGWHLKETDCSGARCVAVFELNGVAPTLDAGAIVAAIIAKIEEPQR